MMVLARDVFGNKNERFKSMYSIGPVLTSVLLLCVTSDFAVARNTVKAVREHTAILLINDT